MTSPFMSHRSSRWSDDEEEEEEQRAQAIAEQEEAEAKEAEKTAMEKRQQERLLLIRMWVSTDSLSPPVQSVGLRMPV